MSEFSVALDSRIGPNGCKGRSARCRNAAEYVATVTYCECIESRDVPCDGTCGYKDANYVPVCRSCAAVMRSWESLTEMEDA